MLGNGPGMALAFLGVTGVAAAAPLNPAYSEAEFLFSLRDLGVKAVLSDAGVSAAAETAAARLKVPVWRLAELLAAEPVSQAVTPPKPDDIALLLHTSGTTARPKLVPIRHGALAASAAGIARSLALTEGDVCLNVMPLFHVHGLVAGVLASLSAGGSVVCLPLFDPADFFSALEADRPTWFTAVPAIHQALLAEGRHRAPSHSLRFVRSCSAALPRRVMDELERAFGVPVVEAYGMTECAHQVASNPLPPGVRKPGSVGCATGVEIAVRSAAGDPVAAGEVGEIVIRGESVLRGYAASAEVNAASFRDGWFRTGDEGRIDSEGYVFLTGRTKDMINRGGEKISPREIDEALLEHPAVAQAVAFPLPDFELGEAVGAAVVLRGAATERELLAFLRTRLAGFKVPAGIRIVPVIPKGPTGKIQRRNLGPQLGLQTVGDLHRRAAFLAPASPTERALAVIWGEVLGLSNLGRDDDFRDLGGNSLALTRVASRVAAEFGLSAPLGELGLRLILREQSVWVDEERKRTPLARTTARLVHEPSAPPRLSSEQQRLWLLTQVAPQPAAFHRPLFLRLRGPVDPAGIARAIGGICRRHAVLRTRIEVDAEGLPLAVIAPAPLVDFRFEDLSAVDRVARARRIAETARLVAETPIDLAAGPLLRAVLVRSEPTDHRLLICVHHLAFDAWSARIFQRELIAGCRDLSLSPPSLQYADYAAWQHACGKAGEWDRHLAYWAEELTGDLPILRLPFPRPAAFESSPRSGRLPFGLSPELTASLRETAAREGVTPFVVLLGALQLLLSRVTGERDIIVGCVVAGRQDRALEDLIGCFINTLPIRVRIDPAEAFAALLPRVAQKLLAALEHQAVPFETVLRTVRPVRHPETTPIFQILLNYHNLPAEPVTDGSGVCATIEEAEPAFAEYDLALTLREDVEEIRGFLTFDGERFAAADIARLGDALQRLIERALENPTAPSGSLRLVADLAHAAEVTIADRADEPECLHGFFERQAARSPGAIAAKAGNISVSYRELDVRANALARTLIAAGVSPDTPVGLCLEPSIALLVGLLGILKSGGAYVPLDPRHPAERVTFILGDTGARVLVTQAGLLASVDAPGVRRVLLPRDGVPADSALADPAPAAGVGSHHLAYVMYTSGSTGKPKGVEIEHGSAVNLISSARADFPVDDVGGALLATSIGFDLSVFEIFRPLSLGGTLIIAPSIFDALALPAVREITCISTVPSSLTELLRQGPLPPAVRSLFLIGEPLTATFAGTLLSLPQIENVIDLYGPTETTVYSTWSRRTRGSSESIGRPISRTQVSILDADGEPLPEGFSGEIAIGGAGLARGYRGRPELTAGRFTADPRREGGRVYRTGDRGRVQPDGNLKYEGRLDDQTKIRGVRVEPGEPATLLQGHPDLADAVVVAAPVGSGGALALVAYVVPRPGAEIVSAELRDFLRCRLPEYLVPVAFLSLAALPLGPSGKLDRSRLPASAIPDGTPRSPAPGTVLEARIAEMLGDALERDEFGVQTDFFEAGGHSLLAARVIARVRRELGVSLPVRSLLEHPTASRLAAHLAGRDPAPPRRAELHVLRNGTVRPTIALLNAGTWAVRLARLLGRECRVLDVEIAWPAAWHRCARAGFTRELPELPAWVAPAVTQLREAAADEPLVLGGFSFGGLMAFEAARQLRADGGSLAGVFLVDTWATPPSSLERARAREWREPLPSRRAAPTAVFADRARRALRVMRSWMGADPSDEQLCGFADDEGEPMTWGTVNRIYAHARRRYRFQPVDAPGWLFRAEQSPHRHLHERDGTKGWGDQFTGGLTVVPVGGTHCMIEESGHREVLAREIELALASLRDARSAAATG